MNTNGHKMNVAEFTPSAELARAATIPSNWYTDPRMLPIERERIFWKTWQPVASLENLLRPGDFVTAEVQGEPLVITRDLKGNLRAYYNVCRHRAGPVAAGKGNRKSLQCRYHGWTYNLDGKLTNAPEFDGVENWNKDSVCLPEVQVDTFGPFVFVNIDPDAEPLAQAIRGIPEEVQAAGLNIETMKFVERRDYVIKANWKVYIDNYLEGYHIPIAHPGLFKELDYDLYEVQTFANYSRQHAPIRPVKDEIQGRDRRYIRTEEEAQALYYWLFPNVMLNIYPDNLQINIILPIDHETTLTIFEWYFEGPGTGEGWESMQQSMAFSDEIQHEDIEICETVQRGLKSRSYDQGRFSVKRENGVHHFQSLVYEHLADAVVSLEK
jgi:choline monooxygenase